MLSKCIVDLSRILWRCMSGCAISIVRLSCMSDHTADHVLLLARCSQVWLEQWAPLLQLPFRWCDGHQLCPHWCAIGLVCPWLQDLPKPAHRSGACSTLAFMTQLPPLAPWSLITAHLFLCRHGLPTRPPSAALCIPLTCVEQAHRPPSAALCIPLMASKILRCVCCLCLHRFPSALNPKEGMWARGVEVGGIITRSTDRRQLLSALDGAGF